MRRIQRKRTSGWLKPADCVTVTRPTIFGNPFQGTDAVPAYRDFLKGVVSGVLLGQHTERFKVVVGSRRPLDNWEELRGLLLPRRESPLFGNDVCCWCALGADCHADVLIEFFAYEGDVFEWALSPESDESHG